MTDESMLALAVLFLHRLDPGSVAMSKVSVVALFLFLSLGLTRSSEALAAPPATASDLDAAGVVAVEVDAADLPPDRSELPANVALVLRQLIAAQDDVPRGAVFADDRTIHVELRPGPVAEGGDVMLRVETRAEGRVIAESAREICVACTDSDVAERAFPLVWSLLGTFPEPPQKAAPPRPTTASDAPAGDALARPRPNRPMLIAGTSLLTTGIAALGTGIALVVVDEKVVSPEGVGQLEVVKYREPGIAVAVVGGIATITGAVLLGLAFRGKSNRVVLSPTLNRSFVGFGAAGRF